MTHSQVSVPLTEAQAHALVDAVGARADLALAASAYEAENGEWVFEATCQGEPDIDAFNALAHHVLGGSVGFSIAALDIETDWVAKSLEGLAPVVAGGFCIYGSHDAGEVPVGTIPILIEAAQAFGTGHHGTTAGCLEAIDATLKRKKPRYMLDVGTGSGVLAIAMAKRTRRHVIATDNDPVAVSAAAENAARNGVANLIVAVEDERLDNRRVMENRPYDLIVANILAGPLVALAPKIGAVAEKGATIVLSGLLLGQAARIIAAYGQHHMVLKRRIAKGEWATLVLEKRD